jgi:hypothetical protein
MASVVYQVGPRNLRLFKRLGHLRNVLLLLTSALLVGAVGAQFFAARAIVGGGPCPVVSLGGACRSVGWLLYLVAFLQGWREVLDHNPIFKIVTRLFISFGAASVFMLLGSFTCSH